MDQLDAIARDMHYVRGRLDKHIDDNAAEFGAVRADMSNLRADVTKNTVIASLDNKGKGLVAGTSGLISAIVAGLAMYFGSGGQ